MSGKSGQKAPLRRSSSLRIVQDKLNSGRRSTGSSSNSKDTRAEHAPVADTQIYYPSRTAEIMNSVSYASGSAEMIEQGIKGVTTLNLDGELSDGVTDMALEYQELLSDTIFTSAHVMSLKLSEKVTTEPLMKISTLGKAWKSIMESAKIKKKHPFTRYSRVDVMYVPLFPTLEGNAIPRMECSLVDETMQRSSSKGVFATRTFDADKMAMVKMSQEFFVRTDEADCIKVMLKSTGIPVSGRQYATVYLLLHVHGSSMALKYEVDNHEPLYLEDAPIPENINRETVMNAMRVGVDKKLERERKKKEEAHEKRMEALGDKTEIILNQKRKDEEEKEEVATPTAPPEHVVTLMVKENDGHFPAGSWILDSGAPRHIIAGGTDNRSSSVKLGGDTLQGENITKLYTNIGKKGVLCLLENLFLTPDIDFSIISQSSLQVSGAVDRIRMLGREGVSLEREGKEVLRAVVGEDGYYYIE